MNVIPEAVLIQQFRESFEGTVGSSWITDGTPETTIFGTLDAVTDEQANALPFADGKTIAQHTAHLVFALDLFLERMRGLNPPADWGTSFELRGRDWPTLKTQLRTSYDAVIEAITSHAEKPIATWEPLHVAGVAAMIGHNAYHLGALRQLVRVQRHAPAGA